MKRDRVLAKNVDEFIAGFPKEVQSTLIKLRAAVKKAAPNADETIKYGIPSYVQGGTNLVHFSAYSTHIGFYPTPSGILAFSQELSKYETSKGTVQFPLNKPLPMALITQIVKFRVLEQAEKAAAKKKVNK